MADIDKAIKELDRMTEDARAMDLEWAIGIDDFATLCEALELLKQQKTMTNEIAEYQNSICGSGRHELTDYEKGKFDGLQIAWNIISEGR